MAIRNYHISTFYYEQYDRMLIIRLKCITRVEHLLHIYEYALLKVQLRLSILE